MYFTWFYRYNTGNMEERGGSKIRKCQAVLEFSSNDGSASGTNLECPAPDGGCAVEYYRKNYGRAGIIKGECKKTGEKVGDSDLNAQYN